MSVATLATEITDRLGESYLIMLTSWDDPTTTPAEVNTTRRNRAITDAVARIQRLAGLSEPTDTTDPSYATYVELVVLGVEYFLLFYRSRTSAETKEAGDQFSEACKSHRDVGWMTPTTDSMVDDTGQETTTRAARFAPSHFNDYRLGRGGSDPDADANGD